MVGGELADIHWNLSLMVTEVGTSTFERLELDCGATLAPVQVAYETYGTLNAAKSNAILVPSPAPIN